ncbi:hypothetical protein ACFFSW_17090 [Saccharothrix longispora]|uniref:Uncharacterized protein n=1 Tax=Saccharothrix longispora TaxID=33920 RepID=A0ABU1PSM1_9PSEU|nr:hypothetical protein [Saccharothrix longispora]MDR6593641.1 hypothetical protein [Saccharothrix longispora]
MRTSATTAVNAPSGPPVRASASTRLRPPEIISAPMRADHTTGIPCSTPRSSATLLCCHPLSVSSEAGTSSSRAPGAA